jgi:hypothetical protein
MLRVSEESEAHFLIRKGLGFVVAVGFAFALNVFARKRDYFRRRRSPGSSTVSHKVA